MQFVWKILATMTYKYISIYTYLLKHADGVFNCLNENLKIFIFAQVPEFLVN